MGGTGEHKLHIRRHGTRISPWYGYKQTSFNARKGYERAAARKRNWLFCHKGWAMWIVMRVVFLECLTLKLIANEHHWALTIQTPDKELSNEEQHNLAWRGIKIWKESNWRAHGGRTIEEGFRLRYKLLFRTTWWFGGYFLRYGTIRSIVTYFPRATLYNTSNVPYCQVLTKLKNIIFIAQTPKYVTKMRLKQVVTRYNLTMFTPVFDGENNCYLK